MILLFTVCQTLCSKLLTGYLVLFSLHNNGRKGAPFVPFQVRHVAWRVGDVPRVTWLVREQALNLGLPSSRTELAATSLLGHLLCVCVCVACVQRKALKECHPSPSLPHACNPAEGLNEEEALNWMQAEGAESVLLLEKMLGEFLLIHNRIHFRFLSSVPTSFSSAATTNLGVKKKSVLFFF